MVLKPEATSSSETLPVPGAANKSNCPSLFVFASFFIVDSLSDFSTALEVTFVASFFRQRC